MKKIIITFTTFAFIALNNLVAAQSPNWAWALSFGSTNGDGGNCVATDLSGNVIMTGSYGNTITFGNTTLTNANGINNIFIVKFDATGNVLWTKSAGGIGFEYSSGLTTDANGNVYITGSFNSDTIKFGTTSLVNSNNSGNYTDIFIAKYDASGNMLWAKKAGNTNNDVASSAATDASGNVYITGYFQSASITFGNTTLSNTAAPYEDLFIVKYDASGNELWAKSAGSTVATSPSDGSIDVATDASGNVFMTGYFEGAAITFGTATLNNTYTDFGELFIVKYDASGNVLWAKSAGSISNDLSSSVATDAMGNVVISGYFEGPSITFGATTLTNANQSFSFTRDIFVVKYNSSGNIQWANRAGAASDEYAQSIATDVNGNVFMTGNFFSPIITFVTDTLVNAGGGWQDFFIVKYNTNGNALWAKSAGSISNDISTSVATDAIGNAYITGGFSSASIAFGATTLTNAGTGDIFIAKIGAAVPTGITEQTANSTMVIAPNPFNSQTAINFNEEQNNTTIKIIDVIGKEIKVINFTGNQLILEKSEMHSGIYIVQIIDENKKVMSRKIIIE